jgi:hypothetical protein
MLTAKTGLISAHVIVCPNSYNEVPVTLLNTTDKPISIKKGTVIVADYLPCSNQIDASRTVTLDHNIAYTEFVEMPRIITSEDNVNETLDQLNHLDATQLDNAKTSLFDRSNRHR